MGRDQIHHALGLSEVELAVEKCALGEFAGCGHHRAAFEKAAEHFTRHEDAAVPGELDAGFAGETSRRTKDREQAIIDRHAIGADDLAMPREAVGLRRGFSIAGHVGDLKRCGPGNTDHRNCARARRRRDGGDGAAWMILGVGHCGTEICWLTCGEPNLQQDRAFAQAKKRPERLHGPGV